MSQLVFFTGTMDSGKSTLALQTNYNHAVRGRVGLVITRNDRAGASRISSRLGLEADAIETDDSTDFCALVDAHSNGDSGGEARIDYLVCDEAQFYTPDQVDQLAVLVDSRGIDVFAFGILTDFRTRLFPGSSRLVELADRIERLPVSTLCWCGQVATHNARIVDGTMSVDGQQVVVGDRDGAHTSYDVLCRRHHMARQLKPAT
ncbi:MAG: thymidine kinase [Cellulomonadaceae bacterium]|jgi:thymidine kinase|nr:thymidine kinase [Cellulomonadaceae bacterium]